jgi:hypothetical protein
MTGDNPSRGADAEAAPAVRLSTSQSSERWGAMAKLNDDQRRALEMLAHQDGCAEAVLLADGFSIDQLAGLVVEGYATMQ